jgi:hypothetical protein
MSEVKDMKLMCVECGHDVTLKKFEDSGVQMDCDHCRTSLMLDKEHYLKWLVTLGDIPKMVPVIVDFLYIMEFQGTE